MELPENSVRSAFSVENVVEKHLQLLVIVKVGSDDRADRRGSSESRSRNVLKGRTRLRCDLIKPFAKRLLRRSYPERRVAALQEKSVGAVPVAIDDVRPSIAVEVGQRHSSAMLVLVGHTFTYYHSCETLLHKTEYGGFVIA